MHMIYVLKMDNPKHPYDIEAPTRVRLIGPFETEDAAVDWARDPAHNPHDNCYWQIVDLDAPVVEVVSP